MWQRLRKKLEQPVSPAPLVSLRILTGLLMLIGGIRFLYLGWVDTNFLQAKLQFKYPGFSWVEMPASGEWLYVIFGIMLLASLGVMLGAWYRWSAGLLFISFGYIELLDLTWYLNHYYFISLLLGILWVLPAHIAYSWDVKRGAVNARSLVPAWMVMLPRFQMGVLYVYAGLAKINADWLIEAMPMRLWLPAQSSQPLLGWLFGWQYTPWLFSWAGMLYDCSIPFWLSWKKSRPWAYLSVLVFHGLTGWLFQIGMFPLVMAGITLVFFDARWHQGWQYKLLGSRQTATSAPYGSTSRLQWLFLGLFAAFQLLFPWRFLLYPGNLYWTEAGYRFSWRVMLVEKAGTATFYVVNQQNGREGLVDNSEHLLPHQDKQMAFQPDLLVQYAHWLRHHYAAKGIEVEKIRAEVYVTLNGKPSRLYFDPQLNLLAINAYGPRDWLNPAP